MAETDDDPIANWQEKVTSLRKRGRISGAALAVIPGAEIDVRLGRPPAPERLSDEERALWERLTHSHRPGWFSGAENVLETYVVTVSQVQRLEVALHKAPAGIGERYLKLLRAHRQAAALASLLATRLRLTPGSKLDTRTPTDGEIAVRLGVAKMDTIDIALLVIVIAIFALIPIGCIMTRKSKIPSATQKEPLRLASISALLSAGHATQCCRTSNSLAPIRRARARCPGVSHSKLGKNQPTDGDLPIG